MRHSCSAGLWQDRARSKGEISSCMTYDAIFFPSRESLGCWGKKHPESDRVCFLEVAFGLCWVD